MSTSEERQVLLSRLVDNELPDHQAVEVLMAALEDAESREQLKAMLTLRQAMQRWRRQEPPRAIVAVPPVPPAETVSYGGWRPMTLAAAAILGAVLVTCGFYLGGWLSVDRSATASNLPSAKVKPQSPVASDQQRRVVLVTPEERSEIARAFALHESVAGPLSWYAADETTIQVAPIQQGEKLEQPIAVVLRLAAAEGCQSNESKTYVIVCRDNDPAVIELPQLTAVGPAHLRLLSTVAGGEVKLQYLLSADGLPSDPNQRAALVGSRRVGLGQTPLGQLALNDCLVNVDASAWVVGDEQTN
jgi:hypothetical protein